MLTWIWLATERRLLRLIAITDKRVARAAAGTVLWLSIFAGNAMASEPQRHQVDARALLATAEKYLGVPYRYGSRGNKVDCSGFVQRVFEEHGIKLPRTSADMSSVGEPVEWSALAPGDLLFFHTTDGSKRVSHVGIALGNGQMIHASTKRQRVSVDSLELAYYLERRVVARRLLVVQPTVARMTRTYRTMGARELLHLPRQL